MAFKFDGKEM